MPCPVAQAATWIPTRAIGAQKAPELLQDAKGGALGAHLKALELAPSDRLGPLYGSMSLMSRVTKMNFLGWD